MRQGYGQATRLFRRRESQPGPPRKETKTTYGSNRPEPIPRLRDQRHQIEASAEKENPGKEQPPRAPIHRAVKRENEQRDRVNEMIKHRLVPHIDHPPPFKGRS